MQNYVLCDIVKRVIFTYLQYLPFGNGGGKYTTLPKNIAAVKIIFVQSPDGCISHSCGNPKKLQATTLIHVISIIWLECLDWDILVVYTYYAGEQV